MEHAFKLMKGVAVGDAPGRVAAYRAWFAAALRSLLTWDWAVLVLIVAASFALRWYRIDDALVGFHVTNEGFYTALGRDYLAQSVFAPFFSPIDQNNPPLYAFALRIVFGAAGASLAAARAVSVFASAATIVAIFLLGRDMYGKVAGLVAATVFGLAPGAVLVGGNAQIEGLMILLRVSAVLAYFRATRDRDPRLAVVAGALLGLATLAKLPAVIVIPGLALWETWGARGLSWLRNKRAWAFAMAYGAMTIPWFAAQTLTSRGWVSSQVRLAGILELPTMETIQIWLGSELFWLVSPIVFIAFWFAVALLTVRRSASDVLVLSLLGANFAFYLFYSYHTYYLLPAVPMLAIAVGALAQWLGFERPRRAVALVTVLALMLSIFAAVIVGGKKWGGWYAHDVRDLVVRAGYAPEQIALAVDADILDSWAPALEEAFPETQIVHYPPLPGEEIADGVPILHLRRYEEPRPAGDPAAVPHRRHGPVFFGYTIELPATIAVHHFGVVDAKLRKVGPWWWFGVVDTVGTTRLRVEVYRP